MGTRSLTHIKSDDGTKTLLTIYKQYDGYPEGLGQDLANLIGGMNIVNGYSEGDSANGMSCLAAQVVKALKDGIGNVYIYPANAKDCGEEYTYVIRLSNVDHPCGRGKYVNLEARDGDSVLYSGLAKDFKVPEAKE